MEFVKRAWKDPVWSKVISVAIVAAAGVVWAHVEGYFNFATVARFAIIAWDFATSSMHMPVLLFAFIVLASLAAGACGMRLYSKRTGQLIGNLAARVGTENPSAPLSPQRDYKTDVIDGLRWRWVVLPNEHVVSLRMYCAKCDFELRVFEPERAMRLACKCGNCGHRVEIQSGSPSDVLTKVTLEAERRVRTGEWKKSILVG